jgi:hypothetical protein
MYGFILIAATISWVTDCVSLINREAVVHNDTYVNELIIAIPMGIHLANVINEVERTDKENLDRCALTIAVARYESTFNIAARNKSCLGMFQITPSTAKDIIKDLSFLNHNLKDALLTPVAGSCIFSLLMDNFIGRYGTPYRALVRYNNSARISKRIFKYYKELIITFEK